VEFSANDIVQVLTYLLPGFVTAWIFFGLTSYPKPKEFERVVQALLFTAIIQAMVAIYKKSALVLGNKFCIGVWDQSSALICSLFFAIGLGIIVSFFANNDKFHWLLRKFKITKETSYASEWFGVFSGDPTYVVLHLKEEGRLYGWPQEWPSDPQKGHFSIVSAEWLDENNNRIPLAGVNNILIPASEVRLVEFMEI